MATAVVRTGTVQDVPAMLHLAAEKRKQNEIFQPVFHRRASDTAAQEAQEPYFAELIGRADVVVLVAERAGSVDGFAIAQIQTAPAVYDPGGAAAIVDDCCVAASELWGTVGVQLVTAMKAELRRRGVAVVIVVCSPLDTAKRSCLTDQGMSVASEWFTQPLD
jgi:hypothetical protein